MAGSNRDEAEGRACEGAIVAFDQGSAHIQRRIGRVQAQDLDQPQLHFPQRRRAADRHWAAALASSLALALPCSGVVDRTALDQSHPSEGGSGLRIKVDRILLSCQKDRPCVSQQDMIMCREPRASCNCAAKSASCYGVKHCNERRQLT